MANELADRVAIVTGGGGGIGRATSLRLADEGAVVYVTDIAVDNARAVAAEIVGKGGQAYGVAHDVADQSAWQSLIALITQQSGRLDILVNNAGISQIRPLHALTLDDWNRDIAVNLTGPFLGVSTALELLTRTARDHQHDAAVINVCSVAALNGTAVMPGYAASKGGLRAFSKSIAVDLMKSGRRIRVNSIFPGMTDTGLMNQMVETQVQLGRHENADDARSAWDSAAPIGRVATPDDMANVIVFLAGDKASYLVGAEIVVDGGKTLT